MKKLLMLVVLVAGLVGCGTKATKSGFTSVEGGWGVVVKTDDAGQVDSVYVKPPDGVTVAPEYVVEPNQPGFENTLTVVKK